MNYTRQISLGAVTGLILVLALWAAINTLREKNSKVEKVEPKMIKAKAVLKQSLERQAYDRGQIVMVFDKTTFAEDFERFKKIHPSLKATMKVDGDENLNPQVNLIFEYVGFGAPKE